MAQLAYNISEPKGMMVNILKNPSASTLGGLSSKVENVLLVGSMANGQAFAPIFDIKEGEDYLVITRRFLFGKWEVSAHPRSVLDSGRWAMFGGNFCFSSDSRFAELNNGAPIKIFDRVESKQQTETLSL